MNNFSMTRGKQNIVFALLLLTIFLLYACGGASAPLEAGSETPDSKIRFSLTGKDTSSDPYIKLNLGNQIAGTTVPVAIDLINSTRESVEIVELSVTCSCAVLRSPTGSIASGEVGTVALDIHLPEDELPTSNRITVTYRVGTDQVPIREFFFLTAQVVRSLTTPETVVWLGTIERPGEQLLQLPIRRGLNEVKFSRIEVDHVDDVLASSVIQCDVDSWNVGLACNKMPVPGAVQSTIVVRPISGTQLASNGGQLTIQLMGMADGWSRPSPAVFNIGRVPRNRPAKITFSLKSKNMLAQDDEYDLSFPGPSEAFEVLSYRLGYHKENELRIHMEISPAKYGKLDSILRCQLSGRDGPLGDFNVFIRGIGGRESVR